MSVHLDTNLAELPLALMQQVASCLNANNIWEKVIDDEKSGYYSSPEEIERIQRHPCPPDTLLVLWGNRGQTVQTLIARLQILSQQHGNLFDRPQLILHRKFKAVRWLKDDQHVVVAVSADSKELALTVAAVGFPCPQFQWLKDDEPVIEGTEKTLRILKCKCEAAHVYTCRVFNVVEEGNSYSDFYRSRKKQFESELISECVNLEKFTDEHACERCKQQEIERLRSIMAGAKMDNGSDLMDAAPTAKVAEAAEQLKAADKVALVIANCAYRYLPQLMTPLCDAQTLAEALQDMHYKTITLADLTLPEMEFIIKEYRKLLGNDVYAVLYFAGHGFEVFGQCYLIPIEAPIEAHDPSCSISMDWVLAMQAAYKPALNVILLDVCRKFVPDDKKAKFIEVADSYKAKYKPNRNTVYGYSTSGGVGAYEVRGEINGVFMKYLKNHVSKPIPVVDVLQRTFIDIENDKRVTNVQIPELRTSLTKARCLTDPLICDGHTASFDHHSIHWRLMHELPNPVYVRFEEQQFMVTIWFDYCGTFTNKVYVFSSVGELLSEGHDTGEYEGDPAIQAAAQKYQAFLRWSADLESSRETVCADESEGVSTRWMLSNLQRSNGPLECTIDLIEMDTKKVIASKKENIGHVLITRIDGIRRKSSSVSNGS